MSDYAEETFEDESPREGEGRSRSRNAPRRRSARGPSGDGSNPLQQRGVRVLIVVGLIIVLALILISSIRGCRRDNLVESYRTYLAGANQIAGESAKVGEDLRVILENKAGKNRKELIPQVQALAQQSGALVGRANDLDPPDRMREPHNTLITALEYRSEALTELPSAIENATKTSDAANGAATLSEPLRALGATDVIYERSYRRPAEKALQADNIKDVQVAQSDLFPGAQADLVAPSAARTIVNNLKRVVAQTDGSGEPSSGKRGLAIVSVFAVRGDGTRIQLRAGTTVNIPIGDVSFEVEVLNGGDLVENGIDVTVTYTSPADPTGKPQTEQIDTIEPGEQNHKTLKFDGPDTGVQYKDGTSEVDVKVAEVEGERVKDNNQATYPVRFTVSG